MSVADTNLQSKMFDKYRLYVYHNKEGILPFFFFKYIVHTAYKPRIALGSTRNIGGKFVTFLLKDSAPLVPLLILNSTLLLITD